MIVHTQKKRYLHLIFDPTDSIAYVRWHGIVLLEDYMAGCDSLLEFFAPFGPKRWLLDQQKMEALDPDSQEWLRESFQPRYITLFSPGIRLAVLHSSDIFQRIVEEENLNNFNVFEASVITVRNFNAESEALRWLRAE